MSVQCSNCGKTWPRDPRLEVPCPECDADVGARCQRPSEHGCKPHIPREWKAIEEDYYEIECDGVPDTRPTAPSQTRSERTTETTAQQTSLFD
jgi:predicted  nucleic acid-binding Zn-ribbon protein